MSAGLPEPRLRPWSAFCAEHAARVARSVAAADALLAGDGEPARMLLAPWTFSADAVATGRLLARLRASSPTPPPGHRAAILAPVPESGPEGAGAPEQRAHLFAQAQQEGNARGTEREALAWGLEGLAWFGQRIEEMERRAWQAPVPIDPVRDGAARALWSQLLGGDFWTAREAVDALWLPTARRVFGAALRARGVPAAERGAYLQEFAEGFFWVLLGGADSLPGWKEIAVRVLEGDGPSAPVALGRHLDADGWSWVVRCPTASSPTWRATRGWALPDHPNALAQARRIIRQGVADPGRMEQLLDGQVALRLLAAWSDPEPRTLPGQGWDVVLRHRTRTRGRLRAVLLETASDRLLRILELPGLAARSERAVAAVAWARAHAVLHQHQVPSWDSSLTPRCEPPPALPPPLDAREREVVQTWVLLVVLRERFGQLEHWRRTGSWRKRPDSGWGRLLQDALPGTLAGADGGYDRVQAYLCLHWRAVCERLRPVLEQVVACRKGPEIRAVVSACWEPEVPLPSRMGAGARRAAQNVLDTLSGAAP